MPTIVEIAIETISHVACFALVVTVVFTKEVKVAINHIRWKYCKIHVVWLQNGQKFKASQKNGKLHGVSTVWHRGGQVEVKTNYKNGRPHGLSTEWYGNGQKKLKIFYKNGGLNGSYVAWYESGQKMIEAHYLNGRLHGPFIEWCKTGQKIVEGSYTEGEFSLII
jgi:antitoxin component YwqK of YwqJK toxin-antitoxin module